MKKKILITGAKGYIGTNLYYYLKNKFNVFGIDKKSCDKKHQKKQFRINILDESKLKYFFSIHHFEFIIHLAAISSIKDFNKNAKIKINENTKMVKNILNCIVNKNTKIIFFSSAAVYKKQNKNKICENYPTLPLNSYGLSKIKCEKLIINNQKNNNFVIFRPFNVIGNLQKKNLTTRSFMQILFKKLHQKNKTIKIFYKNKKGNKEVPTRDFIHVYDICRTVELSMHKFNKIKNNIFNLGNSKSFSLLEIINEFIKIFKINLKLKYKILPNYETLNICSNSKKIFNHLKIKNKYNNLSNILKNYNLIQ